MTDKSGWIDISIPLRDNMAHMPKDPASKVYRIHDADKGDRGTMYEMVITSHAGTHIDAPLHLVRHGKTIDQMPLEMTMGPARVIEIKDTVAIKPEHLAAHNIQSGERILLKTVNSSKAYKSDEFYEDYAHLTPAAAQVLADKKIRCVGIDYIATGTPHNDEDLFETHIILMLADVWIIEGLEYYPAAIMEIYNRWGEQIYHSKNYMNEPFDGTYKGRKLPVDSYHFILRLPGGHPPITGNVTILK